MGESDLANSKKIGFIELLLQKTIIFSQLVLVTMGDLISQGIITYYYLVVLL